MASPEIAPFAKTGGLADMVGSLAPALAKQGVKVSLIMPAYRSVLQGSFRLDETGIRFVVPVADRMEEGILLKAQGGNGVLVYLIKADRYFDRDHLYGPPEGDYPDNAERFVFFSRAILEVLRRIHHPQILHVHDWQSALAIAFLKALPQTYPELAHLKTVFTVHNPGYQGLFEPLEWRLLNLDWKFFVPGYLEFYGKINFLKGGLVFADTITTVSPTYAEELKTPEQGCGLEGVFRERAADFIGILNGADYSVWNPEADPHIAKTYHLKDPSGKKTCKADLQQSFGLPRNPHIPLIGMISRIVIQKGFDLLTEALDELLRRELQLVILGTGQEQFQEFLQEAAGRYPTKMGVRIAFDEALAHKIEAGADLFLMPSLYEPCGLNQMYSLKYGTIPIVRATGGLRDTVQEFDPRTGQGTGFTFSPYEASALLEAVDRAIEVYHQKRKWTALMKNAMTADFSWDRSAQVYINLYRRLVGG